MHFVGTLKTRKRWIVRKRINRELVLFMKINGGKALQHPDFNDKSPSLFHDDTHLSFTGNAIFVITIQSAFDMFICSPKIQVFPSND